MVFKRFSIRKLLSEALLSSLAPVVALLHSLGEGGGWPNNNNDP